MRWGKRVRLAGASLDYDTLLCPTKYFAYFSSSNYVGFFAHMAVGLFEDRATVSSTLVALASLRSLVSSLGQAPDSLLLGGKAKVFSDDRPPAVS